ncbi:helix-turn-helix transcriptional regulator [Pseudogulbenkiania ferrooxidans]|uniref:YheO domain protein n=1 Tax=Pseudogulbenkiania ferrooxidans 2002 TaxID=279714 RepID=B9Z0R2_9NEIS|nr:PAS domain-containing protein [Pseudogulbenkiania ferrooxidans]EEG09668.1 YheO domain protein [Pseudogulbenkiania ferrooxidans 2002]
MPYTNMDVPMNDARSDTDTTEERQLVLTTLKAALAAMGSVVGRNTEIILHDLTQPERSVIDIVNGHVSGRSVGSPVLGGPQQDKGFAAVMRTAETDVDCEPVVIPNYPTTAADGRTLRSATAVFRDKTGQPFASLCINTDISGLLTAQACLEQLLAAPPSTAEKVSEPADMELLMAEIIQNSLARMNSPNRAQNKKAKLEAVRQMQERGIFIVKGGIEKAAAALGVTRYTIYNYLDEIRQHSVNEPSTAGSSR